MILLTFPDSTRLQTLSLFSSTALAEGTKNGVDTKGSKAKPAKGDKDIKGEKQGKNPKDSKDGEAAKPEKSKLDLTDGYVHEWVPFPTFSAMALPGGGKLDFKPELGQMSVIIMIATWCAPCVRMMPEILRLEARTAKLPVRFVHVFTHDTRQDATGFMAEYGMKSGVLANHELLAAFKNPDLPAIFVADRNTWMLARYIKANPKDLADVEESIKYLTAI
jgi:thiol-disulfide isomerase/thioredoxin